MRKMFKYGLWIMITMLVTHYSSIADSDTSFCLFSFSGYHASVQNNNNKGTVLHDLNIFAGSLAVEVWNKARSFQEQSNYDSAVILFEKAFSLYKQSGDNESCGNCLVNIADCYMNMRDFTKSEAYCNRAEQIAAAIHEGINTLNAEVQKIRGLLLIKMNEKERSLDYLIKGIDIITQLKGPQAAELADYYNKLGVNYYILGELDKSIECYEKALLIPSEVGEETDQVKAEIYNNIGIVFKLKGDFIEALEFYSKSVNIKENILQPDDPNLARTYNNIGNLSRVMGKSELAMSYFQKAEEIFRTKFGTRYPPLGNIYTNMGIIFKDIGDYSKSLQYFNYALNIMDLEIDANEIASIYNNIGNVHYELGDYEEALMYYNKSVSIRESGQSIFRARSYSNFALCYDKLGHYDKSDNYHNLAIKSRIDIFGTEHYLLASEYMNYGQFLIERGEPEKGIEYYSDALAVYRLNYGDKHAKTSNCLVNIGDYYFEEGEVLRSLKYYQEALIAVVEDFNNSNIYSNPDISRNILSKSDLLYALSKKARALDNYYETLSHSQQDLGACIETYACALDLVDQIRIGQLSRDSKLILAKNQRELFYNTMSVSLKAFEKTKDDKYQELAFKTAERGKAGILYDFIRENDAKHFANIPDSLIAMEHKLKEDITLYENLIHEELLKVNTERDTSRLSRWQEKVFYLQDQQKGLVDNFNRDFPKYYQYKYTNKIYSTGEVRDYLGADDVLIEYILGKESLIAFCVSQNDIIISEQKIDTALMRWINLMPNGQKIHAVVNDAKTTYRNYVDASYHLYQVLIAPFENKIRDKNLVIIPDGILGYVSFESLITNAVTDQRIDYRNLPYLMKDHAISYGYSATLLVNSQNIIHQFKAREDLLAFAPVNFTPGLSDQVQEQKQRYRTRGEELIDLPATRKEVLNISKILGGDIYLQNEATVTKFKEMAPDYKILHIATHGIVNDKDPMHSKLMFAPVAANDEGNSLQYSDLFNLELNAELAVLSACNTGYGQNSEGEGIMALARGFMYSGVPSLVISLWPVEDESTAELMKYFYSYLRKGYSKDESLRKAKLKYLAEADNIEASPYYWSGFINIGDKTPMELNKRSHCLWLLILVMLIPVFLHRYYFH